MDLDGERAVSSTRENSFGKERGEAIGPRVEALSSAHLPGAALSL